MISKASQRGSALIYILIISLAASIILLSLLQSIGISRQDNMDRYYTKLAEEAAEAGAAYAMSCLNNTHTKAQTWTTGNLTPKTDCSGATVGTLPTYVMDDGLVRTSFSVGNLEISTQYSALIPAQGFVYIGTNPASPTKTYATTLKKTITWDPSLVPNSVASGAQRVCGILGTRIYCWGNNSYGQLGNGTYTSSTIPVAVIQDVPGLAGKVPTEITSGTWHNCVLAAGDVFCWGNNEDGQLGDGAQSGAAGSGTGVGYGSNVPSKVIGLPASAVNIASTSSSTCALLSNATVYCWGKNNFGQLGNNVSAMARSLVPVKTIFPAGVTPLSLSKNGASTAVLCAITQTSTGKKVYCWGDNAEGQAGIGSVAQTKIWAPSSPVINSSGYNSATDTPLMVAIDGKSADAPNSYTHVCMAVQKPSPPNKAYCWGNNTVGTLGNNSMSATPSSAPQLVSQGQVPVGDSVTEVAAGLMHSCLNASGHIYCWGKNTNRALGIGDTNSNLIKTVPTRVVEEPGAFGGVTVTGLIGGGLRSCATASAKLYCWGTNGSGQIGDGTTIAREKPTESVFLRPRDNQFIF